MKILVTGCYGFIGFNFLNYLNENYKDELQIVGIDSLESSCAKKNHQFSRNLNNFTFFEDSILNVENLDISNVDLIINFAAETHVDNSIFRPVKFVESNILGLTHLLKFAKYILDRVAAENHLIVQFELCSPFDVQGLKIPNRYVIGKYCPWEYRGAATQGNNSIKSGCSYNGTNYFDIDGNSVSTLAQDACGKTIEACKLRFHPNDTNLDVPLPFGGFPGSRKFK